ncbi:MAG: cellulose synthase family protein [Phycisphaerae bacterium]|jgi:cellulose synthase/poly-beta-1,6-N-acetylglucosamine synthase-like glycosyltransferase
MEWSELAKSIFMVVYTFALAMVSLYGLHRYVLVFLYYRHRKDVPTPKGLFAELPRVTVQLPMYNEQFVARRIIEKTCEIDYPREKLQIQVLDDSTDSTCQIAQAAVAEARERGFDIEYVHRDDRTGFKAGALENGLKTAKGEFISIFDADFIPAPTFLKRSIHYFTDPRICAVQTRWEHLNRADSMLTRSQAILLDGHFAIEHVARNRSDRFMSFNGTAGTWRREAIASAGGWQHDTLTEDLDLSYRAQMKGWKFVFLRELAAPAELPPEMNAFKAQQFRWTKGGAQTAIKLLPKLLMSRMPLKVKVEGFFHLSCFSLHLYMLLMIALMLPAMYLRCGPGDADSFWRTCVDMGVFALATLSASVFYCAAQQELFGDWRVAAKYMPMMMALGVGLCLSNTKAILEALFGRKSEFVRTPKYGNPADRNVPNPVAPGRRRKKNALPYVEMFFGLYMAVCTVLSVVDVRSIILTPFLVIFTFGFFYVSVLSLLAQRVPSLAKEPQASTVRIDA